MNISRRGFVTGIAAGVAGLKSGAGYRKLIPFVMPAEDIVPGIAAWYASGCRECPAGCGMLLRNREAHIVKAEGNPLHPINQGRLCARGQASLQGLYDPDRLRQPRRRDASGAWQESSWDEALSHLGRALAGAERVGVISDLQSGSLADLIRQWLPALGSAAGDYLVYEPFNYEPLRVANERLFGRPDIPDYHIERADLLISFGADFLETWLSPVELTRRFTEMRAVKNGKRSRFLYIGPRRSLTATQADRYFQVPAGTEGAFARAVAGGPVPAGVDETAVREVREALERAAHPLVLAGNPLPLGEAANSDTMAALELNRRPGAVELIDFGRANALSGTARLDETRRFLERAAAGEFDVLLILNTNPVYSLPPELKAAEALLQAKTVICLNPFEDETVSTAGTWALPMNAPAESWGDYTPAAGVHTLLQPAMGTYFHSRDAGDVLIQLAQAAGVSASSAFGADSYYDYLRNRWRELQRASGGTGDFEAFWHESVRKGGLTLPAEEAPARMAARSAAADATGTTVPPKSPMLSVHPSLHFFDGRHANRSWLQQIPEPLSQAVWGSWVEIHPEMAKSLGAQTGDLVELTTDAGKCQLPAQITEAVAPNTVALATGQGHTHYGRFARGVGVNAFSLLKPGGALPAARLRRIGPSDEHVVTHGSHDQEGREIIQTISLLALAGAKPAEVDLPLEEGYKKDRDVYPAHEHTGGHRWAMAVDLDRCTACNACVVACYAENNIPVVGKEDVRLRHEQPWIRIDRYDEGSGPDGRIHFQPMMCQQCDSAPCEPVCPVYAAVHGNEGLNEQVYNRCVGTRYCSNNCPYKTRRFNWFAYECWPEPLTYQLNPDVTVRSRGVMEKCSFCVQRIKEVTIRAKAEGRPVKDGEITPACAQTCPSDAFVFGDLMDTGSRISRVVREDPRRYQVLRELNTKPAVFYLKKIVEEA